MNVLTFELCAEDRARLDRLIAVEEASATMLNALLEAVLDKPRAMVPAPAVVPTVEAPAVEPAAPVAPVKPAVTLEQIQKKATQIAAGSAEKKAALRALVNRYAPKVTDLPESTWAEVWDALCKLESEA